MAGKPPDFLSAFQQIPGAKPSKGSMSPELDPKLKKVMPQQRLSDVLLREKAKRFMV